MLTCLTLLTSSIYEIPHVKWEEEGTTQKLSGRFFHCSSCILTFDNISKVVTSNLEPDPFANHPQLI